METWTLIWLSLGVLLAVLELVAFAFKKKTLSRWVWERCSIGQRRPHWLVRRVAFWAFSVGLVLHLGLKLLALWSVIPETILFAVVVALSFSWDREWSEEVVVPERVGLPVQLQPEYSWWKTVWKGLRPALWAGGAAALSALVLNVDAKWFVDLGVPAFLATFLAEALRNWVKTAPLRQSP